MINTYVQYSFFYFNIGQVKTRIQFVIISTTLLILIKWDNTSKCINIYSFMFYTFITFHNFVMHLWIFCYMILIEHTRQSLNTKMWDTLYMSPFINHFEAHFSKQVFDKAVNRWYQKLVWLIFLFALFCDLLFHYVTCFILAVNKHDLS